MSLKDFWTNQFKYLPGESHPTPFGQAFLGWLSLVRETTSEAPLILELGAGLGADACAIAEAGAEVVALDFVTTALAAIPQHTRLLPVLADLRQPLPIANQVCAAVFSHLAINCVFTETEITSIFYEIHRVLEPGGELWIAARSTDDPIYKRLPQRGPGLYKLGDAGLHLFSKKSLRRYAAAFGELRISAKQRTIHGELFGVLELRARRPYSVRPADRGDVPE